MNRTEPAAEGSALSLPKGGGAVSGLGEKFSADLFTGAGSFTVPIPVPAGRSGMAPGLALAYATANGNGPFGLGWALGVPGISRRTSRGVPRYTDPQQPDVFVLSGAEDLVEISPGRYRPRTEGLFARIEHIVSAGIDHWEVRTKDGLRTRYGMPVADPADPRRVFGWRVTESTDTFGNLIRYSYRRDRGDEGGHVWDQPLLSKIEYADYGDPADPRFLVEVNLDYEPRPDQFSDYRAGFEIRTTLRCNGIRVTTHAADGIARPAKLYRLGYASAEFNGVSLLTSVEAVGIDGERTEALPPLAFGYTRFEPDRRRLREVSGPPMSGPLTSLVDTRGTGLPDVVEMGPVHRVWRNAGDGRFHPPTRLGTAPSLSLADPGVRLVDADGDGRADLLVTGPFQPRSGYFPMTFGGGWDRRSFRPYRQSPSVSLADPRVRLVDLDGDGLTDVLRSGTRLECWFNDRDPQQAWRRTAVGQGPRVDLADPRIRLADMTGDGLPDLVLVTATQVGYWPNLGHGRFGARITMHNAPHLPAGFDPRRVVLGDVDGDGAADLLYIEDGRVSVWANRSGSAFGDALVITGTPAVADAESIQLSDLTGSGTAGLLFSRSPDTTGRPSIRFLDFTGGVKPYLLETMDNRLGAVTRVAYVASTQEYLRDEARPGTRWRTTLPFPVQVVSRVDVHDAISGGVLTTRYRYHHGYWDGVEREFRGFAMVEQLDTDVFDGSVQYSPPTLTKSWFHPGPVAALVAQDWTELDLSGEYWPADPAMLERPVAATALLATLDRSGRRDALRSMRGHLLRTEAYALDGSDKVLRPYTVTESVPGVRRETDGVYFPFTVASRSTHWERGDDPMTKVTFSTGYDAYGFATGEITVGVPRGRDPRTPAEEPREPYLATYSTTEYARRDDAGRYLVDRISRSLAYEIVNDGRPSVAGLRDLVQSQSRAGSGVSLRLIGESRTFYDGDAYAGLPLGTLGEHGLAVRSESLAFTDAFLGSGRPAYLDPQEPDWPAEYPPEFRALLPDLAGYVHYTEDQIPGSPGGYYITTARRAYDVQTPGRIGRGLLLGNRDPLEAQSSVEYDQHDLLAVRTVDPLGLQTLAVHDYRLLATAEVTDANGNRSSVGFSPAGFVTEQFVRGRDGEGDAVEPSLRLEYDLHAWMQRAVPASIRTTRRVRHDTDAPSPDHDDVLVSVDFSDGFGRLLQSRRQAEEPGTPDSVAVSGWQTYDNKGRVVRKFEPFFASGYEYAQPGEAELGQKSTFFYDPNGRTIRTVEPDGSEIRVVLGVPFDLADPDAYAPTPWESYTYDANDNAGRTHPAESAAYRSHWNTPSSVAVDALGRTVLSVQRNGSERLESRSVHDILGNLVEVTDPLGRTAFGYTFDLLKRRWRTEGIDGGTFSCVLDVLGNTVEMRDARGSLRLTGFDLGHRMIRSWARDTESAAVTLRQRIEYGEGAAARTHNLLGRIVRHYDEAGLSAVSAADFKGNELSGQRRVIADAAVLKTYDGGPAGGWNLTPFTVDWDPPSGVDRETHEAALLEAFAYQTDTEYDALNRIVRQLLPQDVEGTRPELRTAYHRSGQIAGISLNGTAYVTDIAYDAKGRRTLVAAGNGVTTRYTYDPVTLRLTRMLSEHGATIVQDFGYEYDLAGNILVQHSADAPDRLYTYDPVYRLLTASGRETDVSSDSPPWTDIPRSTDITRTRPYTEAYAYDAVGSLLRLAHSSDNGYTREFTVDPAGNRMTRMTVGGTHYDYAYDGNGNLRSEAGTRRFTWNHGNQLVAYATQTDGAEPSVHAQYLYDATGRRVKKLVRKQGGAVLVTHYLGAAVEHERWTGSAAGENTHLHVLDVDRRAALVRIGPAHPGDRGAAVAYHLNDHLDSSTAVLDETGAVTNREEFTPYGETSFGSFARKRYRFTGKERDEESGLNNHGARYALPWAGRWTACDPLGPGGGLNQYLYAAANPIVLHDPTGAEPQKPAQPPASGGNGSGQSGGKSTIRNADPSRPHGYGNIGPYKDQPPADYDGDVRLTENEHPMCKNDLQNITRNPLTGQPDYTDAHYHNDTTLRWEREAAKAKTNAVKDGPLFPEHAPDTPASQANKGIVKQGGRVSYTDVRERSLKKGWEAQAKTGSVTTKAEYNTALLEQEGNLFALQRLGDSGKIVSDIEKSTSLLDTFKANPAPLVGKVCMGLDLYSTSKEIVTAKTTGQQVATIATATGRWAGMAYGAAACSEFGPFTAAGCGLFGAIFGEAAVKGFVSGVSGLFPAGMAARQAEFERIIKLPPKERDFMLRATCLSGGPSCHW